MSTTSEPDPALATVTCQLYAIEVAHLLEASRLAVEALAGAHAEVPLPLTRGRDRLHMVLHQHGWQPNHGHGFRYHVDPAVRRAS